MRRKLRYFMVHDLLGIGTNLGRVEIPKCFERDFLRPDMRILEGDPGVDIGSLEPLGLRLFINEGLVLHKCFSYGDLRLLLKDLLGRRGPTEVVFTPQYRVFREKLRGESIWHFLKLVIMTRLLAREGRGLPLHWLERCWQDLHGPRPPSQARRARPHLKRHHHPWARRNHPSLAQPPRSDRREPL